MIDKKEDINLKASISLAKKAKKANVKRFLFSSSCIMYGVSKSNKSVTEKTSTDPQTIYAKSKVSAEKSIAKLMSDNISGELMLDQIDNLKKCA